MEADMGLLDDLARQATGGRDASGLGGLVSMVASNPQILSALTSLLSSRDSSVGGSAGLGGLLDAFQQKGLGNLVAGWVSTGQNPSLSAAQVADVLGPDTVGQFASKAGIPADKAGSLLAQLLPTAVDRLTPDGKLPDNDSVESSLGSLLSGLMK
jgi:uncharacterized protein YidB (DUF937 family)